MRWLIIKYNFEMFHMLYILHNTFSSFPTRNTQKNKTLLSTKVLKLQENSFANFINLKRPSVSIYFITQKLYIVLSNYATSSICKKCSCMCKERTNILKTCQFITYLIQYFETLFNILLYIFLLNHLYSINVQPIMWKLIL